MALLVIPAENSMKADPAAHIPSCRRDRCENMDRSSAGEEAGWAGMLPSGLILSQSDRNYLPCWRNNYVLVLRDRRLVAGLEYGILDVAEISQQAEARGKE